MSLGAIQIRGRRLYPQPWQRAGLLCFLRWCAERAGPRFLAALNEFHHTPVYFVRGGLYEKERPQDKPQGPGRVLGITRPHYKRNRERVWKDRRPRFSVLLTEHALRDPVLLAESWVHELKHLMDFFEYVMVRHGPQDSDGYSVFFPNSKYGQRNWNPYSVPELELRAEVAADRFLSLTPEVEIRRAFAACMDAAAPQEES